MGENAVHKTTFLNLMTQWPLFESKALIARGLLRFYVRLPEQTMYLLSNGVVNNLTLPSSFWRS